MHSPHRLLAIHELGARVVPSATGIAPVVPVVIATASPSNHPLHGAGTGTYHTPTITIDAGTSFTVTGKANLGALGSFTIAGEVHGVGMIAEGRATGDLVLSDSRGTMTLRLHGPIQKAFEPVPHSLVYTVSKSTGAFQHVTGYGSLEIQLTPIPVPNGKPMTGKAAFTFS
jgi:hypothetical protein